MYLEIATIDSSQAAEADVVIATFARCNDERNIGFLYEQRHRLLVGLSRARDYLIMVLNRNTFQDHEPYKELLQRARDKAIAVEGAIVVTDARD